MPEVRRQGRRSPDAARVAAAGEERELEALKRKRRWRGVAADDPSCPCAIYWSRLIALMERAVYQQTPQALSIDEYLPQVVYEPYKARHPLPAPVEESPVVATVASEVETGTETATEDEV